MLDARNEGVFLTVICYNRNENESFRLIPDEGVAGLPSALPLGNCCMQHLNMMLTMLLDESCSCTKIFDLRLMNIIFLLNN